MAEWRVAVRGLRELNRTFKHAPKDVRRAIRDEYRTVAEPVRSTAATLAASSIRRIGPKWSQMRTGVTQRLVYVAPKQRGVKTRGADPRRRPNLGDLLADTCPRAGASPARTPDRSRLRPDARPARPRLGHRRPMMARNSSSRSSATRSRSSGRSRVPRGARRTSTRT